MLTHEIPPDFPGGAHLFIPLLAIGSVPSLSGHAIIAYLWRSLLKVRRRRASVLKVVPVTAAAFTVQINGGMLKVVISSQTQVVGDGVC